MNLKNTDFQNIPWDDIVSFGQKTMLDSDLFSVSWILGRFCNYNCSYCWPYARSNILDYQEFKIYTNTIDEIKKQARENGFTNFHFSFSGGEPTAYKRFNDLIKYYANDSASYQSFHMTSNCSPSMRWWQKIMPSLKLFNRASITASFHAEFADEEQFTEKLLYLLENGIFITINQVMVPEFFFEYLDRCQRFYDSGIPVTLKPQSNETASDIVDGYTDEMLDIMQTRFKQPFNQILLRDSKGNEYDFDQAERFNAFGFNKFNGWSCSSGYQSVVIRSNEVKRSYSCSDKILGTLTDGFDIFSKVEKCITNTCISSADSKVPKWK
jgi:hypothetical protein